MLWFGICCCQSNIKLIFFDQQPIYIISKATATLVADCKQHLRMMRDILLPYKMLQKKQVTKKSRRATENKVQGSVADMYEILGPVVWRKAYQMSYELFDFTSIKYVIIT